MKSIQIKNQTFYIHPERVLLSGDKKMLIVSDLHIGKSNHFRKNGIALTQQSDDKVSDRFFALLEEFNPEKVLFLGDLFHSEWNFSCENFAQKMRQYHQIEFILVQGNHDILNKSYYEKCGIFSIEPYFNIGEIIFSHDVLESIADNNYNIFGHLHPAVKLKGKSKQVLKLNCFYFGKNNAVLPAFNQFSGKNIIKVEKGDRVFVLNEEEVYEV